MSMDYSGDLALFGWNDSKNKMASAYDVKITKSEAMVVSRMLNERLEQYKKNTKELKGQTEWIYRGDYKINSQTGERYPAEIIARATTWV